MGLFSGRALCVRCEPIHVVPCLGGSLSTPPAPLCESNTLVKSTAGVGSATFGTVEFGGSIFWWSMKITFFWFEAGGWYPPPPCVHPPLRGGTVAPGGGGLDKGGGVF